MQKKFVTIFAIIIAIIFSFSVCFAAEDLLKDASNTVKDAVNNTEDAVEGAVHNAGNTIHDSTEKAKNTMENAGNKVEETGNNLEKDMKNTTSMVTNTNNDGYTAARTSTNGTFMGMNATAWTWLILGIAAIAIIAVVWYYSTRISSENNQSKRD